MIRPAPGSIPWLLRQELRLFWRRYNFSKWRIPAAVLMGGGAVLAQLVALGIAAGATHARYTLGDELIGASLMLLVVGCLMLCGAFGGAIEALFERRDLDWLLTSPVSFSRVLVARMLGIAAGVTWLWLLLLGPLANAMAVFGKPGALAFYPVLVALALLATATGTGLAVALVPVWGLRRTRAVATGLALVTGAVPLLLSQANNLVSAATRAAFWLAVTPAHGGMPQGVGWWPARALLGNPMPLAAVVALGLGAALLCGVVLGRRFAAGALAQRIERPRTRRAWTGARFTGGMMRVLLLKELRLLRRAPGLLGQAAQQLVFLIPVAFTLWRDSGQSGLVALTTLPVIVAEQLARLFISAAISGDEAAELARTAPVPARSPRLAKLVAAGVGVAAVFIPLLIGVAVWHPSLAPVMLAGIVCVTISGLLLGLWHPSPVRKLDLGGAKRGLSGMAVLGFAVSGAWAGATCLAAVANPWAIVPACIATALVTLARPAGR